MQLNAPAVSRETWMPFKFVKNGGQREESGRPFRGHRSFNIHQIAIFVSDFGCWSVCCVMTSWRGAKVDFLLSIFVLRRGGSI